MRPSLGWLLCVLLLAGCSARERAAKKMDSVGAKIGGGPHAEKEPPMARPPNAPAAGQVVNEAKPAQSPRSQSRISSGKQDKDPEKKVDPRKIIYTGQMDLLVQDLDDASAALSQLLKEQGGYIAHSNISGQTGQPRSGQWTLKVPAANFDSFMDAVAGRGKVTNRRVDSDDVTENYFDTRAEVKNLEVEEEALRKLATKVEVAGSKTADILEVKRELQRVRGEINVRMARLQRWDKLVEFATITLNLYEKGAEPPPPPEFGTALGRTFSGSLDALVWTGKAVVLVLVALTPWLGVAAVLGVVVWLIVRFSSDRRRPLVVQPIPPPPPQPRDTDLEEPS